MDQCSSASSATRTGGGTAVAERPVTETEAPVERDSLRTMRARQREEFGGVNWGAAFFGWLVAVGLGALLVGLLAAMGAAVGLTDVSATDTAGNVTDIGIGGTIALLAALVDRVLLRRLRRRADVALRRRAPGHGRVADRPDHDGRAGDRRARCSAPSTTCSSGSTCRHCRSGTRELASGGALALALVVLGTLLAAVAGGKAGEHFHRKVDRAGFSG